MTSNETTNEGSNMNKPETVKLFKTLFTEAARTRIQWVSMVNSLVKDGELTLRQGDVFKHYSKQPTIKKAAK